MQRNDPTGTIHYQNRGKYAFLQRDAEITKQAGAFVPRFFYFDNIPLRTNDLMDVESFPQSTFFDNAYFVGQRNLK